MPTLSDYKREACYIFYEENLLGRVCHGVEPKKFKFAPIVILCQKKFRPSKMVANL